MESAMKLNGVLTFRISFVAWIILHGTLSAQLQSPEGQVLVLTNESTLVGQVDRDGAEYRIRSRNGETLIPASRVARVCPDLPAALVFLRSRANLQDPDERVRLARWCWGQGLRAEAIAELKSAQTLQPRSPLIAGLLKAYSSGDAVVPAQPSAKVPEPRPSIVSTTPPIASGDRIAISQEHLAAFTRRVQPLLFNTCATASCHGDPQATFRVAGSASSINFALTDQNLQQALRFIDRQQPERSRLLQKAAEPHGRSLKIPLPLESPGYKNLESWVFQIAPPSTKPQTIEPPQPMPMVGMPPAAISPMMPLQGVKPESTGKPSLPGGNGLRMGTIVSAPLSNDPPTKPTPPSMPKDPFDPEIFNREQQRNRK
jgi:hypothetical protein